MPTVSSISQTDSLTLSITGLGFQMGGESGFVAGVSFVFSTADTVTVNSDTSITAVFNNGIPKTLTAKLPSVYFTRTSPNATHWASVAYNATISNRFVSNSIATPISCSFAGACNLTINEPGLLNNLINDPNTAINVCGQPCTLLASQSSASSVQCSLAPLPTTYSIMNYQVIMEDYIVGNPFSSLNNLASWSVFDGSY